VYELQYYTNILIKLLLNTIMHIAYDIRQTFNVWLHQNLPSKLLRLHEYHATSTYCCRTRVYQILHLENHCHRWLQFNYLTITQSQLFIIIQYSIHILYPHRIHWTIKYYEFSIIGLLLGTLRNCHCQHSVCPLLGIYIYFAVKLL